MTTAKIINAKYLNARVIFDIEIECNKCNRKYTVQLETYSTRIKDYKLSICRCSEIHRIDFVLQLGVPGLDVIIAEEEKK